MDIVRHIIHIQISLHSISSHFYWFRRREKTRENTSSDLCIKYWFIDFPGWLQKFTSKLTDWQRREQLAVKRTLGKRLNSHDTADPFLTSIIHPLHSHFDHIMRTLSSRAIYRFLFLSNSCKFSWSFTENDDVHSQHEKLAAKKESKKSWNQRMEHSEEEKKKKFTARWWWREVTRPKYISRVYSFHSAHE